TLDEAELERVVDGDVDRPVPAFGETADAAGAARANGAEAGVDCVDDVVGHERLPALARPHAVRPLLVDEGSGRPERHHEDHRPGAAERGELVLDDAEADSLEEGARPPRLAVQQIEHRVAHAWM